MAVEAVFEIRRHDFCCRFHAGRVDFLYEVVIDWRYVEAIINRLKPFPETAVSQSSTVATTTAVAPVKPEPKQLKYLGFSGFQSSDPNQKIVSFLLCEPMSGSSSVGQFSVPQSSSGDCQIRKLNDFSKWRIDGSRVLLFLLDDDENPQFFVSNPKILRDLDRMQMLP